MQERNLSGSRNHCPQTTQNTDLTNVTLLFFSSRFHPENAQEFISIKKTKSESWKCDVIAFNL